MREPLYLRGAIWWCRVRNRHGGKHRKVSTGCKDRRSAVARWQELERESVTPAHQAAHEARLGDALDERIAERKSAGRAAGTIDMLTKKARQLTRVLGSEARLSRIDAAAVDEFIATRLREGAKRTTIQKELSTLRGALRLAKRHGKYPYELAAVMPLDFSAKYKPKERALSEREIERLLSALPPKRAAVVAFLLATGATYPSEVTGLRKGDVDTVQWFVRLRGTKRATRDRRIPIVDFARGWLRRALPFLPFESWSNIRRDLHLACAEVGIAVCSPNDLRRSVATLMRARGVEPSLIGAFLGHKDSRMAERVYGRLAPEQLAHLLEERLQSRGTARVQRRAK